MAAASMVSAKLSSYFQSPRVDFYVFRFYIRFHPRHHCSCFFPNAFRSFSQYCFRNRAHHYWFSINLDLFLAFIIVKLAKKDDIAPLNCSTHASRNKICS